MAISIHTAASCVRRTDQRSYVERQRNTILAYRDLDPEFDFDKDEAPSAHAESRLGDNNNNNNGNKSKGGKHGVPETELFLVVGDSEIRTFHRTYNLTTPHIPREVESEDVDLTIFKGEPVEMRIARLKAEMAVKKLDADGKRSGEDVELSAAQRLRMSVAGWAEEPSDGDGGPFPRNKWKAWFRHGRRRNPVAEAAATEQRLLRAEREKRERSALKKTQKIRHHRVTCIHHRNAAQFLEEARARVRDKKFPREALEDSQARLALSRNGSRTQVFGVPESLSTVGGGRCSSSTASAAAVMSNLRRGTSHVHSSSILTQVGASTPPPPPPGLAARKSTPCGAAGSQRNLFPNNESIAESRPSSPGGSATPASTSANPSRQASASSASRMRLPPLAKDSGVVHHHVSSPVTSPIPRSDGDRKRSPSQQRQRREEQQQQLRSKRTPLGQLRQHPSDRNRSQTKIRNVLSTAEQEKFLRNYYRTYYDHQAAKRDHESDDDDVLSASGSTGRARSSSRSSFFLTNVALAHEQQQQQQENGGVADSPERNSHDNGDDAERAADWTRLCSCTPRSTDDERSDSEDDDLWADDNNNENENNNKGSRRTILHGALVDDDDPGGGGGGGGAGKRKVDDVLMMYDDAERRKKAQEQAEREEQLFRRRQEWLARRRAAKGGVREPTSYNSLVPFELSAVRAKKQLEKFRRIRNEMESLRAHQLSSTIALRSAGRSLLLNRARPQLEEAIVQPAMDAARAWSRARSTSTKQLKADIAAHAASEQQKSAQHASRCVTEQIRSITPIPTIFTKLGGVGRGSRSSVEKQKKQPGGDGQDAEAPTKQDLLRAKMDALLSGKKLGVGGGMSRSATPSVASSMSLF